MNQTDPQPNYQLSRRAIKFAAYWFKLIAQPILAVVFVISLAWLFGYMQRHHGWFDNATTNTAEDTEKSSEKYACSMLCVFAEAPGRCPVCGMELQKIETTGDPKDLYGVTIDPTARRLANIQTVAALNVPVTKDIEVLGRIEYDESTVATVSSYVDGRIEDLLINYTGATIRAGDELAVVYSPDLYADQVGLLQAKAAASRITGNDRIDRSNKRLYESSRRRLIELGVSRSEVNAIESAGKANHRVKINAPLSGTVVQKLIDEGQYVKTGMPILRIADLSSVWLMLEMYPDDVSNLKLGQSVSVELQSRAGKTFAGKVSFIKPIVDSATRTVDVRVAISNDAGLIKVGDLGKAKIHSNRAASQSLVVVPRQSVLMNGADSVAYVETDPGRFEFRKLTVAETLGDRVLISDGMQPGELVVASGVFMLDSTFNIQGKVSLIDPHRATVKNHSRIVKDAAEAEEIEQALANLSPADRKLAQSQIICPVTEVKLGSMGMGVPIKVDAGGKPVMICCEGCRKALLENPEKHFQILNEYHTKIQNPPRGGAAGEDLPAGNVPEVELPQMELPEVELPQMELPETEFPQTELPVMELPSMEAPE